MTSYKDIQRETGLSLATISKYFNGRNVLESNRVAIENAARTLNFRPNEIARSLRLRRSRTIGVLLPALKNEFHLTIISGVEDALRTEGMGLIVASSPRSEDRAVDLLLSRMVDGIIAVASPHDVEPLRHAATRIPVVLIDWEAPVAADGVFLDNIAAGAMGARQLLDHGHRRIGILGGDRSISTVRDRADGATRELAQHGADVDPDLVTCGPLSVEEGQAAMTRLLALRPRPSAVFALNYELTVGALIATNESGLRLGRDFSLVGFDSPELARAASPRLTIVAQPTHEIAAQAAAFTVRRLKSPEPRAAETRLMTARLVAGESVARVHK